jgi:hypothetical protein
MADVEVLVSLLSQELAVHEAVSAVRIAPEAQPALVA